MIATQILAKVDTDRLQRGVEGLASGAYTIQLTRLTESEISAYVANGDGKTYAVTLTEQRSFCACGDSMFRGKVCKHSVALALFVIRNPKPMPVETEQTTAPAVPSSDHMIHVMGYEESNVRPINLKLGKMRRSA